MDGQAAPPLPGFPEAAPRPERAPAPGPAAAPPAATPVPPDGPVPTSCFPYIRYKFPHFNPPQSDFFRRAWDRDTNVVVAANTSAGKTVVAEMAIQAAHNAGRCALYLSPLRALTSEKHQAWTDPNHAWSARRISIVTGDYQLTERRKAELDSAEIIAMTSEMLDSRVKKIRSERSAFLMRAGVVVVDEAHLLGSEGRGAALENALMGFSRINPACRLVLLSATLPNVRQIADWVRSLNGKETTLIESEYRPCRLDVHFEQYREGRNYMENQQEVIRQAASVIDKHKPDKFIAFVHTKKAGRDLKAVLEGRRLKVEFHSADLERDERQDIEEKFRGRELDVVVATSTLAMGLNLPARRVVILGTKRGQQDVSWLDIRQMCGRAGRVGLDPQGDAHIVVAESKFLSAQKDYNNLPPVQSCLFDQDALAFHVIAEIDSGQIGSPKELLLWHSRSLAHFQGQKLGAPEADALLAELDKWGLIDGSRRPVETTSLGKVAALTYYSPYDVASWAMNFRKVFKDEPSDILTAWALSEIPTVRKGGYVAADVATEVYALVDALLARGYSMSAGGASTALAYMRLLRGDAERHFDSLSPVVRQCRGDAERIALALKLIDAKHGRWGRQSWFDEMALRVRYGVNPEAAVFCSLDGVGAVRAKSLVAAGFRSVTDLLRDPGRVIGILKERTGRSVLAQAAKMGRGA